MRTVGVEEELLLVDPESGEPLSLATQVVRQAAADPEPVDETTPGGTVERSCSWSRSRSTPSRRPS